MRLLQNGQGLLNRIGSSLEKLQCPSDSRAQESPVISRRSRQPLNISLQRSQERFTNEYRWVFKTDAPSTSCVPNGAHEAILKPCLAEFAAHLQSTNANVQIAATDLWKDFPVENGVTLTDITPPFRFACAFTSVTIRVDMLDPYTERVEAQATQNHGIVLDFLKTLGFEYHGPQLWVLEGPAQDVAQSLSYFPCLCHVETLPFTTQQKFVSASNTATCVYKVVGCDSSQCSGSAVSRAIAEGEIPAIADVSYTTATVDDAAVGTMSEHD